MSSEGSIKEVVATDSEATLQSPAKPKTYILGYRGDKLNNAITVFSGIGFLLFGYDQGVMGSLLTLEPFIKEFPTFGETSVQGTTLQGAVIALYEVGAMAGALAVLWFERFGRLKCIFIASIIITIGGALQACSYTLAQLLVCRIFTGIGTGLATATIPVYAAEVSPPHTRGRIIFINCALIALGIAISYWVDFGFYFTRNTAHSSVSFRAPIAFQCIFSLILAASVFKFPESPRWLMQKNRAAEAQQVFATLFDRPEDDEVVKTQMAEIQSAIDLERSVGTDHVKFKELFNQGPTRDFHRLMLSMWSQCFQQISGINLITYYAGTIYEKYLHMSPLNSRILASCTGTEYFLASIVGVMLVERLGRRFLLFWGAIGQAIAMAVLTACTWKADQVFAATGETSGAAIAAAVFLFVFNTVFAFSYLGGTWLLPAELPSLKMRTVNSSLSTTTNWAMNFLIVLITPVAFRNIGPYTYTIFAAINLLMAPCIYTLYPETKGRTLEEMDFIFAQCPTTQPWKVVGIARRYAANHSLATDEEKPAVEHDEGL